ncbi:hypothetical protein [Epilithonimonas sp.]|uniref:hypothetical protein n=1 Tax=Epilithonimonas sp. TaxID=2894511 RepID=UPI00289A1D4D|nr:hypothetical protein [Epilithonimonas sp.]
MLENKKILFVSVSFFNYEKIIKNKLEQRGAIVDLYDERPSNSIFIKGLLRIKRDAYALQIKKYYSNILEEVKNKKYDYFLLIKGEVIPIYFIKMVKELNPGIVLIYYNFDSFYNNPNALDFLPLFDHNFTFDTEDAEKYNLNFRPLFYSDDYEKIRLEKQENKTNYDIAFIGTAHSDRYLISEGVSKEAKKIGLKHFAYYYSQGRSVFLFKKLFDKSFKKFDYKKLSFNSLSHSQIIDIYKSCNYILDINHPSQKGLTMRTFEALGAGKKLITTNTEIAKYKIFESGNVLLIDRNTVKLEPDFFKSSRVDFDDQTLYAMSIDGWIDNIFFIKAQMPKWF